MKLSGWMLSRTMSCRRMEILVSQCPILCPAGRAAQWVSGQDSRQRSPTGGRSSERLYPHIDLELVPAAADDHAAQGRDVAEVAAPGQRDVILAEHAVVGGIEIQPAERRTVHGNPGMRGIPADRRFAPSAHGSYIAADVARSQSRRTYAADHEMREVLANAAAALEHIDN